jgi:hypothetical protein
MDFLSVTRVKTQLYETVLTVFCFFQDIEMCGRIDVNVRNLGNVEFVLIPKNLEQSFFFFFFVIEAIAREFDHGNFIQARDLAQRGVPFSIGRLL